MSDEDEASFLGRWARRKAQARQEASTEARAVEPPAPEAGPDASAREEAEGEPFDLASLPSLESIDAATDVSVFLRREVPDWLRNAALKKAWAADPAIRDYVNPAMEYAYDWNAPGGVPGAGALEAGHDALRQAMDMLSQTPGEADERPHTLVARNSAGSDDPQDAAAASAPPPAVENVRRSEGERATADADPDLNSNSSKEGGEGAAPQAQTAPPETPPPRRRHGGATPV